MSPQRRSLAGRVLPHAFALLLCVGLPAAFTWMAPVSTVELSRANQHVSARITNCLLLAVPYRETKIDNVTQASDEFHRGETKVRTETVNGQRVRHTEKSEDEAYLILSNDHQSIKVPVSPANIKEALAQTQRFLAADQPLELRFKTVANWKFSVLVGGLLTLLAILYALVMAWKAVSYPIRLLRTTPGADEADSRS